MNVYMLFLYVMIERLNQVGIKGLRDGRDYPAGASVLVSKPFYVLVTSVGMEEIEESF